MVWRRVFRDNADDPRVIDDVGRLASAYGTEDVEIAEAAEADEPTPPPEPRSRWWWLPPATAHVRRYRTAWGATLALLAVVVLLDPVPAPTDAFADAQFGSSAPQVAGESAGNGVAAVGEPGATAFTPQVGDLAPADLGTGSPPPAFGPDLGLPDDEEAALAPEPLQILESGYASITGGTPLEFPPPEDGLPVAASLGQTSKISFVRLTGTASVLQLRLVSDPAATINEEGASLRACRITNPGWSGERGVPLEEAPAYDAADCVDGVSHAAGSWVLDLSRRTDVTDPNGFALVPGGDPGATFQLTFSPTAG